MNSKPNPVIKMTPITMPAHAQERATVTVFFAPSSRALRILVRLMCFRVDFLRSAVGIVLAIPHSAAKGALNPSSRVPIIMINGRNRWPRSFKTVETLGSSALSRPCILFFLASK